MVSYSLYYSHLIWKKGIDFFDLYRKWFDKNCLNCPFYDINESGICQAEFRLKILSKKKRNIVYIAIYYHKNYDLCNCLIKPIISKKPKYNINLKSSNER